MKIFPDTGLGRSVTVLVSGISLGILTLGFLSFSLLERKTSLIQAERQATALGGSIQWAIRHSLRETDIATGELQSILVELSRIEGVNHIEVVGADGFLVAHTHPKKVGVLSEHTENFARAISTGSAFNVIDPKRKILERYIPIQSEQSPQEPPYWVAEVVFSTDILASSIGEFTEKGLAITLALTVVLTGLLVYGLRRSVMSRIVRQANFAHRISQGDFQARLEDASKDEIGRLSRILNAMAKNLDGARSKLERKIEAQKEVDQFKDNFLAMVSHELRTPLTAVIGFSDAILEGYTGGITENQRRLLKKILENGENLKQMLNNILDYEKIQSGRMDPVPWMASPEEIIDYCLSLVEIQAEQKGVTIVRTIPFKLPPVRVDVMQIQSIITNLLTNAVKFTPSGGKIEILGHVLPVMGSGSPHIEILVSDTGIGIPTEEREKVFFRFYQVQRNDRRDYSGAGLGLALARELALAHGGWLQVRDREGWATTFSFGIPVDSEQPASAMALQKTDIHLPTMINGIIHMLEQEQGQDLGIVFPLPVYGIPDHCIGDRAYLRAILINIIQNSLRYRVKETLIRVRLEPRDNAMVTTIENRGPAFSALELERIFGDGGENAAVRSDHQPRFMSLRSARKILLALDGSLEIKNITAFEDAESGGGVRFTISLPLPQAVGHGGADVKEKNSRY